MRRAGEVVRVAQGTIVVRVPDPDGEAADHPTIGTAVIDESLRTVGTVVDVFGPVARPYLAVDPDPAAEIETPATLLGTALYAR